MKNSITVPTDKKEIKKVSFKILDALKSYNLDEEMVFDIRLSTEEALRNAMQHGNKGKKELSVDVSYAICPDALEITIEDKGGGFDYKSVPDPTTEENILRNSGRGVYLINKLMDEVHFNSRGNKIRMVKYLRRQ